MDKFVMEFGFDCKQGKSHELQQWLSGNEEKLGREAPEGCNYLGTYAAIYSSHRDTGNFKSLWAFDNYAAQDSFSAAMKEGGPFARLMEEFTELMDQDNHAHQSSFLMRRVTDAAIWGE